MITNEEYILTWRTGYYNWGG